MTVSEEAVNQLTEAAKSNLTTIYSELAANTLTADSLPLTERFAQNYFEGFSEEIGAELYSATDYITISDFSISEIELTQELDEQPVMNAGEECRITLPLTFEYTYKLTNSNYTYSAATEDRSGIGYAIITYTFANGTWQLDDIALQAKF